MLKVGLTGGIGSGKTTVAQLFASLGAPVIDADQIAHHLVANGQPALLQIHQAFGEKILTANGELDRNLLRSIVFADPHQKKRLEAILHPLIYTNMQQQMAQLNNRYCILVIPLLLETQMDHFVDRILVVDCPVALQIDRVMTRDHLSLTEINAIIASQVNRTERCQKADDLIDNSLIPHKPLAEQVKTLHNSYSA